MDEKNSAIKINILSPFVGALSVQYESRINNDRSYQIGLNYFSGEILKTYIGIKGFVFTPEYRFYFRDFKNMRGFYVQPFLRYGEFWDNKSNTIKMMGTGYVLGLQNVFFKKIVIDLYLGPLYTKFFDNNNLINSRGQNIQDPEGLWIRGGITVGYLF